MDYQIPVWHPFIAHFPVALLLFGALTAAVYGVLGRAFWREVSALAVGAGALGALATYLTGDALYEMVEGTPIVEELVGLHEVLGLWTVGLSLGAFGVLAGITAWQRMRRSQSVRDPLALRALAAVLAGAAGVLVVLTGRLGGLMVWGAAG